MISSRDRRPSRIVDDLLIRAGFKVFNPDPDVAWKGFKDFLQIRIPRLKCVTVGFQCVHNSEIDIVFLSFTRTFENIGNVGCAFSHPVTQQLYKVNVSNWWWPKQDDLRSWQKEIEETGAFRVSMRLGNWKWLGHSL